LKITIFNGKSIAEYSPFATENEIILSPNMDFFVSSEVYLDQENNYSFIDLVEQASNAFVF